MNPHKHKSTGSPGILLTAVLLSAVLLSACGLSGPTPLAELPTEAPTTAAPTHTRTPIPTGTATQTATQTATVTPTSTQTPTPLPTDTPSITPSPTYTYPTVTVIMQANCRYGPGTAYLYSWGLYPGDTAVVHGRNSNGTWLWILPDNLNRHCWMAASVAEVHGDVFAPFPITPGVTGSASSGTSGPPLPHTTFAGPPGNVQASRSGDQVTVTWDEVPLSDDKRRGYLLEATVCQNGELTWLAVQTYATSYTFTDEATCSGESGALLYTAEKHGYSDPVVVPWP